MKPPKKQFTHAEKQEIRRRAKTETQKQIAADYGVPQQRISEIVNGKL